MMYVFGYTELETGKTVIEKVYFETFDYTTFCKCISDCLKKECEVDIKDEIQNNTPQKGYYFEVNEEKDRILVKKKTVSKGYIYNSSDIKNKYSFFYSIVQKTYNDDISIASIIEDYQKIVIEEEPIDFISELKKKIDSRKEQKSIKVESNFSPKNILQEELEREIFLRKRRKEKREKKISKKRAKREFFINN